MHGEFLVKPQPAAETTRDSAAATDEPLDEGMRQRHGVGAATELVTLGVRASESSPTLAT